MEGEEEEKTDPDEEFKKKSVNKKGSKIENMRHERERLLLKTAGMAGLAARQQVNTGLPLCPSVILPIHSSSLLKARLERRSGAATAGSMSRV